MRKAWIAAALGVVACAPTEPAAPPAPLVRAELAPDVATAAAGEARIAVRAVTAASGRTASVAADCTAEGSGFRAAFTAPAEVAVPTFGQASPPVTVRCASGGLRGAALAQPATRRANGLAGWPAVGVGVSSGGGSYVSVGGFWGGGWGTGPQTYAVQYPAVEVVLQ
jgi:hypothetical protein